MNTTDTTLRTLIGHAVTLAAIAVASLAATAAAPVQVDASPALAKRQCRPFCGPPTPKVTGRTVYDAAAGGTKQIFPWDAGSIGPVQLSVESLGASSPVLSPDWSAIANSHAFGPSGRDAQRPVHSGGRFSTKARMPSRWSSVAKSM